MSQSIQTIYEKTEVGSPENVSKINYRLLQSALEICQLSADAFKMKGLFRMRHLCDTKRMSSNTRMS
jgi:hypothetical protein